MTQRKVEHMTTAAFPEPNHTQTPNNFFDMVPDMSDAELRVTIVMIRNTFGWHRCGFKMGVEKLGAAAGLSRQGTLDGAAAAEARGTFRRINPDTNKEAEWELVVDLQPVDPSSQLRDDLQPVEGRPQAGRGLSGVKESIKKVKEIEDEGKTQSIFSVYENEIGMITPMIADSLEDWEKSVGPKWVCDAIHEAAIQNKRGWKYCLAILERWKAQGNQQSMKKLETARPKGTPSNGSSWLAQKERELQNVRTA